MTVRLAQYTFYNSSDVTACVFCHGLRQQSAEFLELFEYFVVPAGMAVVSPQTVAVCIEYTYCILNRHGITRTLLYTRKVKRRSARTRANTREHARTGRTYKLLESGSTAPTRRTFPIYKHTSGPVFVESMTAAVDRRDFFVRCIEFFRDPPASEQDRAH